MDRKLLLLLLLLGGPARGADPGELTGGDSVPQELQALLRSPDPARRRAAVEQLEGLDSIGLGVAAPLLLGRLRDDDAAVRARAAQALGRRQVLDASAPLIERLSDPDATVRGAAAEALGQFGALPPGLGGRAAAAFARALGDAQFEVRLSVLQALGHLLSARALGAAELPVLLGPILLRIEDDNVGVRRAAVASLGRLGEAPAARPASGGDVATRAVVPLLGRLSDSARDVRAEALSSLAALGVTAAAPAALRLLHDPADEVRQRAAQCLGRLRAPAAAGPLAELLLAPTAAPEPVRSAAARALGQIASAPKAPPAAMSALLAALGRDDLRLPVREALLELGPAALPALLERLAAPLSAPAPGREGGAAPGLSEVGALVGLIRELGATAAPALRAAAGAALSAELPRGRVPRDSVIEAIGGLGDPGSAALLAGLLGDGDVTVRRRAVVALRRPGLLDARALDALRNASRDGDGEVRRGAIEALGEVGQAAAVPRLAEVLWQGDAETRLGAAEALGRLAQTLPPASLGAATGFDERAVRVLEEAATSARPGPAERRVRRAAAAALASLVGRAPQLLGRVLPALTAPLRRPRVTEDGPLPEIVAALGGALRGRPDEVGRETLLDLALAPAEAHTPEAALALDALDALCAVRDPQAVGRLGRLLDHRDPLRRLRAAAALGCLLPGADAALPALLGVLGAEAEPRVRAEAAWALSRLPTGAPRARRAVTGLRAALGRNRAERGDAGERANLTAALALLRAGEPGDAELLGDRDPAVRANAAILLGPVARTPGLQARLRHLEVADWDHRVRRAAQLAQAARPAAAGDRRHFLGMHHVDYDNRVLAEARFRLTLPDGIVRVGTTDGRGTAREELLPPGTCEVEVIDEGLKAR